MFPQRRMFLLALALRTWFTFAEQVWTREVFAVTNETMCGEDLPFGTCGTPLTKDSSPFFCMNFKDTEHDAFTQEFYVNDVLQFTTEWEFVSGRKTLKERFINAESNGEVVKWGVQTTSDFFDPGSYFHELQGVWKFSSNAHLERTFNASSGRSGFSADDASWGAGNGENVLDAALKDTGSLSKNKGWGQENSDSQDNPGGTNGGGCNWWYAEGDKQTGATSIKNVLYWKRSEESEDQGTCFHGATQVTLEDKTTKAMTELQLGDKIQTADIHGNLAFAPIISLPHKAGNSEMATFLKIVTDAGKSVQMTPGHLIPNCEGKMLSANKIAVGDCVMTVDGKETVSEVTSATHFGVYTAVTAHALIVADGIIASPFSVENDPRRQQDNVGTSSFLVNFLNIFFAKVSAGLRGSNAE